MRLFRELGAWRPATQQRASPPAAQSEAREMGDHCRDDGRWHEAAVWYRKHLDQYPDDVEIWVQTRNCPKEAG